MSEHFGPDALSFIDVDPVPASRVLEAGQCYLDGDGDLVVVLANTGDGEGAGCVVVMKNGADPYHLDNPVAGETTPGGWRRVIAPVTLLPNRK